MVGPCLCGDPYCGSCGNPAEAEFADLLDEMVEEIRVEQFTIDELRTFISIGMQAVKLHRGMLNRICAVCKVEEWDREKPDKEVL